MILCKVQGAVRESLARSDKAEADIAAIIDQFIERNRISAPEETLPRYQDGYALDEITELDLRAASINTIIWAIGYEFDYSFVKVPMTDEDGYPIQQRGVTQYPGLYFVGLSWLHKRKSPLLMGVGEDADYIASHITDS